MIARRAFGLRKLLIGLGLALGARKHSGCLSDLNQIGRTDAFLSVQL